MNPELLLAHFNRISDAPDAIPRFRRFILDLAVRGKLVARDPRDEPIETQLARCDETRKAIAKKDHRADADLQTLLAAENRWVVPPYWQWRALADLVLFIDYRGKTPTKVEQGVRLLTAKNIKKGFINLSPEEFLSESNYHTWMTRGLPKVGDALFTTEAPMGNAAVVRLPERFALAQRVICFRPYDAVNPDFLVLQLLADSFQAILDKTATGLTAKGIKAAKLKRLPVALPPLAEQHRIVAKINELMTLCDRLEVAKTERETRRNRLAAASHHNLKNGADAEAHRRNGHFYLNNLPKLAARPDQIKMVRQTILSLALRGRLVPQDSSDEPADVLLHQIEQHRAKLLNQGYPNPGEARTQLLKQQKQFLPEGLRPLPIGWQWATLMQCSALVVDCHNKTAPYSTAGVILLRTTNIRDGRLNLNEPKFVDEQTYARWSARCQPEPGDILITREAPMGEVCIVPQGMRICLGQRMMLTRPVPNTLDPRFLLYSLRDPSLMDRVQDKPVGATVQHLRVGGVETLLVAIPPIEEQRRIVAKVDELMALCDRLEAQLTMAQTETSRLLESVLHHALASSRIDLKTSGLDPTTSDLPSATLKHALIM